MHRAAHALADRATIAFEGARERVRGFLNAKSTQEIIWVKGTTEGINLVAQSWARENLRSGDVILISMLEHHANIVPWQQVAIQTGATVEPVRVTPEGEIDLEDYRAKLSEKVKLVAVSHVSNALGTINPVAEMTELAHAAGAKVLIDGAQATPHMPVDVQALDCDFYVFSSHKVFGPTGIGALYGKQALLEAMPPWQTGGEMIERVSFDGTTFNQLPFKFEAGTPAIAQAVGLTAALDYVGLLDREAAEAHEAGAARSRRGSIERYPGNAARRYRHPQSECALIQHRRNTLERFRHPARPAGNRDPKWPSLYATADESLRHHRHCESVLRFL